MGKNDGNDRLPQKGPSEGQLPCWVQKEHFLGLLSADRSDWVRLKGSLGGVKRDSKAAFYQIRRERMLTHSPRRAHPLSDNPFPRSRGRRSIRTGRPRGSGRCRCWRRGSRCKPGCLGGERKPGRLDEVGGGGRGASLRLGGEHRGSGQGETDTPPSGQGGVSCPDSPLVVTVQGHPVGSSARECCDSPRTLT